MPTSVRRLSDLPVIVIENDPPVKFPEDAINNAKETAAFKKDLGRPVYRLIDMRKIHLDFGEMVVSMGAERGMEGGSGDPDVITLFVGESELVEFGTKALAEQDQYGKAKVFLFKSQEEALDFVRQQEGK